VPGLAPSLLRRRSSRAVFICCPHLLSTAVTGRWFPLVFKILFPSSTSSLHPRVLGFSLRSPQQEGGIEGGMRPSPVFVLRVCSRAPDEPSPSFSRGIVNLPSMEEAFERTDSTPIPLSHSSCVVARCSQFVSLILMFPLRRFA